MKKFILIVIITIISINFVNSEDITESLLNLYSSPSMITNIKALATEKSIEIRFDNSRTERELVIYRSTNPIINYNDLLQASLITTFFSSDNIFIDFPLEGIPYFYLIMDSLLTQSGDYVILQNQNVTSQSILIQNNSSYELKDGRETLRNQPLPYLDLKSSIESGKHLAESYSELPIKYNLTFESQNILDTLIKNIYTEDLNDLKPVIIASDVGTSNNSEEYQLKRILESDFKDQNWLVANKLLSNFLSVEHAKDIETNAHFYLAQVLFFQNKFKESFMEFTIIHEELPLMTRPWMDRIFTYLQEDH